MLLRSLLFVPGDKERLFGKAVESGADAVILDLEDAVREEEKERARALVFRFLQYKRSADESVQLFVRINPILSPQFQTDLDLVCCSQVDGLVLPKCEGPEDVCSLARELERRHAKSPLPKILAIAGETARGVMRLARFVDNREASPWLLGLSWGPYDLATDLGYSSFQTDSIEIDRTLDLARSLSLLTAKAVGTRAIDTVYADFRNLDGLRTQCTTLRKTGWSGKLAIHPNQIEIINDSFRPTADEIREAERIIEAFQGNADGTIAIEGKMLDQPHLKQAQQVLALAKAYV